MIEPVAIGRQRDVDLNLEAGLAKALGQGVGSGLSDVIDVVVREDVQADDAGRLEGLDSVRGQCGPRRQIEVRGEGCLDAFGYARHMASNGRRATDSRFPA